MQYTKPMVDLVYEIRRRVDSAMKPSVKMANPDVLKELADYHQHTKDSITKALIKELLFMAGPDWAALLEPAGAVIKDEMPRQVVKVYRGQTVLQDAPAGAQEPPKAVRLYRGQPVI
jgi:hypothetical protein